MAMYRRVPERMTSVTYVAVAGPPPHHVVNGPMPPAIECEPPHW